jgi:rhodanese-related sulfurtransferase
MKIRMTWQSSLSRRQVLTVAVALVAGALAHGSAFAQPGLQPRASSTPRVPTLNRGQIDALLAQPNEVLVLDVRRPDEVSAIGGFPAYLSIQLADLERLLPFVPRNRTIITVSNHAARAQKAAALLVARGFRVAGAVGAQTYDEEGGTLTGQKTVAVAAPGTPSK